MFSYRQQMREDAMKRLIISVLLVALVGIANAGHNPISSCGYLHQSWLEYKNYVKGETNVSRRVKSAIYLSYIAGAMDFDRAINFPEGMKYSHGRDVVGKWLEKNPEEWHRDQSYCVATALQEALSRGSTVKNVSWTAVPRLSKWSTSFQQSRCRRSQAKSNQGQQAVE